MRQADLHAAEPSAPSPPPSPPKPSSRLQEVAVRQADLHAAEQRRDAGAVRGQVRQEGHHLSVGGDGGLQAADEGVAVDGLDDLVLLWGAKRRGGRGKGRGGR